MVWIFVVVGVVLLGVFLYWQLIIAEGAYMGRRIVALLYDWSAHMYDRIKQFDVGYEQWFLARPLSSALFSFPNPLILDVATGTARLPRTLFQEVGFRGRCIGLDLSRKMLEQAVAKTASWSDRVQFLWDDASDLPFPDDTFEAVACLEALEFMPDPDQVLVEMVRVLRPGGILLTTNRIGRDATLLPGRTYGRDEFKERLQELSLEMVQIRPWQEDYDLVWALKPGVCTPVNLRRLETIMRCPICRSKVDRQEEAYRCENDHLIPIADDSIVELEKARSTER